jgi:Sec-independent protein translocase protein TatA
MECSRLHWLIVGLVALVVLPPEELPRAARSAGRAVREMRRIQRHVTDAVPEMLGHLDDNELVPDPHRVEQASRSERVWPPS